MGSDFEKTEKEARLRELQEEELKSRMEERAASIAREDKLAAARIQEAKESSERSKERHQNAMVLMGLLAQTLGEFNKMMAHLTVTDVAYRDPRCIRAQACALINKSSLSDQEKAEKLLEIAAMK